MLQHSQLVSHIFSFPFSITSIQVTHSRNTQILFATFTVICILSSTAAQYYYGKPSLPFLPGKYLLNFKKKSIHHGKKWSWKLDRYLKIRWHQLLKWKKSWVIPIQLNAILNRYLLRRRFELTFWWRVGIWMVNKLWIYSCLAYPAKACPLAS